MGSCPDTDILSKGTTVITCLGAYAFCFPLIFSVIVPSLASFSKLLCTAYQKKQHNDFQFISRNKLSAGLSFTHYVWVFVYIVFYGSCFEGNRGENLICNPLISVKE